MRRGFDVYAGAVDISRGETAVNIRAFVDEGLGNSSYVVDLGDRRALVVDPSRDPRPYLDAARRNQLEIAFAADTHLHADFLSGSRQLAAGGAQILASARGDRAFPHRGLHDGEDVDLGGLTLRALATPGHTLEHLSFLLLDGSQPLALFSGGALLAGAVARTDLVDPERTEELARYAYRSVRQQILALPDEVPVYPTHGAGSFCSVPAGAERTTTIGRERASSPLLAAPTEDAFVSMLVEGFSSYPTYFQHLAEVNRRGPRVFPAWPSLAQLDAGEVRARLDAGAVAVDVRPIEDYAAGHIPGALSIALRPAFATWLGWLVDAEHDIVFIAGADQDRDDLVSQALKIGYEKLAGELTNGMASWRMAGYSERRIELVRAVEPSASSLVDVRQTAEFIAGHIPGAVHVELGSLPTCHHLPDGPLTLMCEHGSRAMTGASVLERAGHRELSVLVGGPHESRSVPTIS